MRLIDADKLIERLKTNEELYGYLGINDIESAPTVEAKPVIHAHWEWKKTPFGKDVPFCTHCNKTGFYTTNYCSCCGAKMDEEEEND